MSIDTTYEEIIKKLKEDVRPRIPNKPALINEIKTSLELEKVPSKKLFCVICHLSTPEPSLATSLTLLLKEEMQDDLQIFLLEAIQKHVLDARMISGDRLSPHFLKAFNDFIKTASKGVLYYIVGIVEDCGSQNIIFRQSLSSIKWGFMDAFIKNHRETISRIDALEKRWQKIHK